jgi:hypothetical protein
MRVGCRCKHKAWATAHQVRRVALTGELLPRSACTLRGFLKTLRAIEMVRVL